MLLQYEGVIDISHDKGDGLLVSAAYHVGFIRDGQNRDIKRTINGVSTYLIYGGWNLIADHRSRWRLGGDCRRQPEGRDGQERASQYDAAGNLATQYIHGPQVDEILAKVTPSSTTYPLPDALGSTIAVTNANGTVLERVFYHDAFGTPSFEDANGTPLTGTSTETRFLFTGREWIAQPGIYDYRNRTYSAKIGRFMETDPIRFKAGDANLYRYVGNMPTLLSDPFGLMARIVPQIIPTPSLGGGYHEPTEMRLQGEEEVLDDDGCCIYKICHYSGLRGGYQDEGGGQLETNTSSVGCKSTCPETNGWASHAGGGTGPQGEPDPPPWDMNRPGAPTLR